MSKNLLKRCRVLRKALPRDTFRVLALLVRLPERERRQVLALASKLKTAG